MWQPDEKKMLEYAKADVEATWKLYKRLDRLNKWYWRLWYWIVSFGKSSLTKPNWDATKMYPVDDSLYGSCDFVTKDGKPGHIRTKKHPETLY